MVEDAGHECRGLCLLLQLLLLLLGGVLRLVARAPQELKQMSTSELQARKSLKCKRHDGSA